MNILVSSGVGANEGKPFVKMESEALDAPIFMSPSDAREVAMNLLYAAEGAETDTLVVEYMRKNGIDDAVIVSILTEMRILRETNHAKK